MEENNYVPDDEPQKTADVYRNYRPTIVPFELEKQLEFIDISDDGYIILGSSNLNGRYWRGSVLYYRSAYFAPNKDECICGIDSVTSVCDGKFLDSRKTVIIGEDSGAVTIYELSGDNDESVTFKHKSSRHDHDSSVLSIAVSSDKKSVVTAGMDMCINVWDTEELIPVHTIRYAHSNHVTSVAYPENSAAFASCGLDGAALLWDPRQSKPVTVLVDNPQEGLTAVAWLWDPTTLAVGSAFGTVSLVDVRMCTVLNQSSTFNRSVYRMLSFKPGLLACCADSHEVKVIDSKLSERYVDERHTNFARGLAYDKQLNTLYSCGWDQQLLPHTLKELVSME